MIYLDNAATTYPKPKQVTDAVIRCMKSSGGNPGRSGHIMSRRASREVYGCREQIAALFGGKEENVVFTENATYAINLAITALAVRNRPIVISDIEHNAVLRPASLHIGGYRIFNVGVGKNALHDTLSSLERVIEGAGLVVCNHVSNLCGLTLPIEEIGNCCRKHGVRFVIDASQSAGQIPIDITKCQADAICAPSHKGLYGIQGCGFVLFSDKYSGSASSLPTFVTGGSGVMSLSPVMPDYLPERYEAGTLPTPAIASLTEGIKFIRGTGIDSIREHEYSLADMLKDGLQNTKNITLYGEAFRGSTVLFNLDGVPSESMAEYLDKHGICVRAGYHCCPLGHKFLRTSEGGAVRVAFSVFNTKRDVEKTLRAIRTYRY